LQIFGVIKSNFSNACGQKIFKESIPDIYIPELKMAIFVNGCYFHGHFNDKKISEFLPVDQSYDILQNESPDQTFCQLRKPAHSMTLNKKTGKTYSCLQMEFWEK